MREGPGYEPCQNREKKSGVLDELATARARLLEKASAGSEKQVKILRTRVVRSTALPDHLAGSTLRLAPCRPCTVLVKAGAL